MTFNGLTGKTAGTGNYSTSGYLIAGRSSGGTALVNNDGGGSASVTFNHVDETPEQNGNAGRINVNTDVTTGSRISFGLGQNVVSGVPVTATEVAVMNFNGDFVATGEVTAYSDRRVKDNIKTFENALDKILNSRGVTFTRVEANKDKDRTHMGVIAQEIQEQFPEVVNESNDTLTVNYGALAGAFIEAFKEQQTQINELKELVRILTDK